MVIQGQANDYLSYMSYESTATACGGNCGVLSALIAADIFVKTDAEIRMQINAGTLKGPETLAEYILLYGGSGAVMGLAVASPIADSLPSARERFIFRGAGGAFFWFYRNFIWVCIMVPISKQV
jgi:hypothetical protein